MRWSLAVKLAARSMQNQSWFSPRGLSTLNGPACQKEAGSSDIIFHPSIIGNSTIQRAERTKVSIFGITIPTGIIGWWFHGGGCEWWQTLKLTVTHVFLGHFKHIRHRFILGFTIRFW